MDLMMNLQKEQRRDAVCAPATEMYLLNGEFCIINGVTEKKECVNGTSFFDLFPAKRALREEISAYVSSRPQDLLLTLCSRTPVLFVGTLFAHTGLILAVLPQGAMKKTLSFPGAFHHVPGRICVSASAQMLYKAHSEEDFAAAAQWLLALCEPLSFVPRTNTFAATLSFYATRLSALCGVPFSCDFSGLSGALGAEPHLPFAVGVMLGTLLAARRCASVQGVRLYAASEGAPTLYLEFVRSDLQDMVPEFSPLLSCAAARGAVLDVVSPKEEPHLVQIRACIGIVELSAQGLRERHRFLTGKSPLGLLPSGAAIPMAFPELLLDS